MREERQRRLLAINATKLDQNYRIAWEFYGSPIAKYWETFYWSLERYSASEGKWVSAGESGGRIKMGYVATKNGIYPRDRD